MIGRICFGMLALAICLAAGCGDSNNAQAEAEKQKEEARQAAERMKAQARAVGSALGLIQMAHITRHKKGAANEEELEKFLPEWVNSKPNKTLYVAGTQKAVPALKRGEWVLVWNATMPKDFEARIIAWEKDALAKGGLVVNGLGEATEVTAEEFAKKEKFPAATEEAGPKK